MASTHQQSNRQLQERETSLGVSDVLASATKFFARNSGVYSAFIEKQGPTHVVMRGQGGEELVIAARESEGRTIVTGSTYLFDQQIALFFDSLPPFVPPAPQVTASDAVAGLPAPVAETAPTA